MTDQPKSEVQEGEGSLRKGEAVKAPSPDSRRRTSRPVQSDVAPMSSKQRNSILKGASVNAYRRMKAQYENTYRMEPMAKFRVDQVTNIIRDAFEKRLKGVQYDGKICQDLARTLASEIKQRVKDLRVDRYKYVVIVTIGQRQDSELILGSRCLLDTNWDTYATYNFESFHIFATGIVYAFYFE